MIQDESLLCGIYHDLLPPAFHNLESPLGRLGCVCMASKAWNTLGSSKKIAFESQDHEVVSRPRGCGWSAFCKKDGVSVWELRR